MLHRHWTKNAVPTNEVPLHISKKQCPTAPDKFFQTNLTEWWKAERAKGLQLSHLVATGTWQQWSSQVRARQGLPPLNYMPALKHYWRKSTNWRPSAHKICSKTTGTLEKHFQKQRLTHRNWKWACQKGLTALRQEACLNSPTITPSAMLWLD